MHDPVTPAPAPRPTCQTCRWWDADEHTIRDAAEGFDRYAACCIRSTPSTFPSRHAKNWCGEHAPVATGELSGGGYSSSAPEAPRG